MKKVLSFLALLLVSISFLFISNNTANAWIFSNTKAEIPYCKWDDCWLYEWIEAIEKVEGIQTKEKASEYIQWIVKYILSFIALIGTIYIIYAWFTLLVSAWDEEKTKNTKNIIIYVIIWMMIIFLAGPIIDLVLKMLE